MLRTSDGDVLIFGNDSPYGSVKSPLFSDIVDRLKGEPFRVPLLNTWQPLVTLAPFPNDISFIGDEAKGDYSYLLAMRDYSDRDTTWRAFSRRMAFVVVRDTSFTLLPTTSPVPLTGVTPADSIMWQSPFIADRRVHKGYVHGVDLKGRQYVLCVAYDKRPAPVTLYYTDVLTDAGSPMIVLTADGDLMLMGGYNYNKTHGGELQNDNFSPFSTAYLLHLSDKTMAARASGMPLWLWITLPAVVIIAVLAFLLLRRRRQQTAGVIDSQEPSFVSQAEAQTSDGTRDVEMMQRICDLLESGQLYLNSDLKLADVAARLCTNRNTISACINSQRGISFSQLVGTYRVEHAKQLMRSQPGMKISEVWMSSGFNTETSFFRTFKALTGMTPSEFRA